jgi:hypothetical protein
MMGCARRSKDKISKFLIRRASPSVNTLTHPRGLLIGKHTRRKSGKFWTYMTFGAGRLAGGRDQDEFRLILLRRR